MLLSPRLRAPTSCGIGASGRCSSGGLTHRRTQAEKGPLPLPPAAGPPLLRSPCRRNCRVRCHCPGTQTRPGHRLHPRLHLAEAAEPILVQPERTFQLLEATARFASVGRTVPPPPPPSASGRWLPGPSGPQPPPLAPVSPWSKRRVARRRAFECTRRLSECARGTCVFSLSARAGSAPRVRRATNGPRPGSSLTGVNCSARSPFANDQTFRTRLGPSNTRFGVSAASTHAQRRSAQAMRMTSASNAVSPRTTTSAPSGTATLRIKSAANSVFASGTASAPSRRHNRPPCNSSGNRGSASRRGSAARPWP